MNFQCMSAMAFCRENVLDGRGLKLLAEDLIWDLVDRAGRAGVGAECCDAVMASGEVGGGGAGSEWRLGFGEVGVELTEGAIDLVLPASWREAIVRLGTA